MPNLVIKVFRGHTRPQKQMLVKTVTSAVVASLDSKPGGVTIEIFELRRDDFAVGGDFCSEISPDTFIPGIPLVTIEALDGIPRAQKRALVGSVTSAVAQSLEIDPGSMVVRIAEQRREDVAIGGKFFAESLAEWIFRRGEP